MKRLPKFFLPILALSALMIYNGALAGELCPNPKPGMPSISFGMTGVNPYFCKRELDRARWLGFTSVSLSPTFYWTPSDGSIRPDVSPTDLLNCLDYAKSSGFDIIFKPMIEQEPVPAPTPALSLAVPGDSTPTPVPTPAPIPTGPKTLESVLMTVPSDSGPSSPWRAYLDFRPNLAYQEKVIEPFLRWIEVNSSSTQSFNASLVVATEMHRSLIEYPDDWNQLMWNARARLKSEGLGSRVQIGIDPTVFGTDAWLPPELIHPVPQAQCERYYQMLWTADFFSSSVYGDFVKAGFQSGPAGSVATMYLTNESNWEADLISRGCTLDPMLNLRFQKSDSANRDLGRGLDVFWPGEMGYAGALNRTWSTFDTDPPYAKGAAALDQYRRTTLVTEQEEFIQTAPVWVKAILDHARTSHLDTVNFWVTGRFDLFGFSDLPPLGSLDSFEGEYTRNDPVTGPDQIAAVASIRDTLKQYTADRCASAPPPAAPTPLPTQAPSPTPAPSPGPGWLQRLREFFLHGHHPQR